MADSEGNRPQSSAAVRWLSAWYALSRPPFHLVGLFPFVLGNAIAWRSFGMLRWEIAGWGAAGVVLVMLSTYYAGEYWDIEEDLAARERGASRFSGGSGIIQSGRLQRRSALYASILALILALGVGCLLFFFCGTGPLTIPLGLIGITGGFLYSSRPVRWVSRGVGELWIAICYGWLPVAVGFYLQAGGFLPQVHLMALPISFSVFNVILLNEFPDYEADLATGKANLLVRLGHRSAVRLYAVAAVLGWAAFLLAASFSSIPFTFFFYIPFFVLSAALVHQMVGGEWRYRERVERLCGANILVNLGTSASLLAGVLL